MYKNGDWVEANHEKYLEYTYKAARWGDPQALFNMGQAFRKGDGVPLNPQYAVEYYRQSAQKGYAPAQNEYALMLLEGDGVERDIPKAFCWLSLAAQAGIESADKNLQQLTSIVGDKLPQLQAYAEAFANQLKSS